VVVNNLVSEVSSVQDFQYKTAEPVTGIVQSYLAYVATQDSGRSVSNIIENEWFVAEAGLEIGSLGNCLSEKEYLITL